MMTVTEKAAYLKGLVEMAHFEADTDEVKIIKALVDVIDELALSVADLEDEVAMMSRRKRGTRLNLRQERSRQGR